MNSDHIDHKETISIPKALKQIDSNYQAAHFGKWGMGSHPTIFGYDISDGPNQNKEGGLSIIGTVNYTISDDPNIFSITNKAVEFMKNAENKIHFILQISHCCSFFFTDERKA